MCTLVLPLLSARCSARSSSLSPLSVFPPSLKSPTLRPLRSCRFEKSSTPACAAPRDHRWRAQAPWRYWRRRGDFSKAGVGQVGKKKTREGRVEANHLGKVWAGQVKKRMNQRRLQLFLHPPRLAGRLGGLGGLDMGATRLPCWDNLNRYYKKERGTKEHSKKPREGEGRRAERRLFGGRLAPRRRANIGIITMYLKMPSLPPVPQITFLMPIQWRFGWF